MKLINILSGVITAVLLAALLYTQVQSSKKAEARKDVLALHEAFHEWQLMTTNAHKGIISWIYLPITDNSERSKRQLQTILDYDWPELESRIEQRAPVLLDEETLAQVQTLLADFGEYKSGMMDIMISLRTFEDYEDPMVAFMAEDRFTAQLDEQLQDHAEAIQDIREILTEQLLYEH